MRTKAPIILAVLVIAMSAANAEKSSAVELGPNDSPDQILAKAVSVVPSDRQIAWQQVEFAAFLHFGMNTFTDREWGEGTEDEKLFNPTDFDARQWMRAVKAAGIRMVILTCKHHDGFCLWPSKYTEHCVRNSPWRDGKGDVVAEVAKAAHEAGLKFGIYVSPWDRHDKSYGDSAVYNEHMKNQLRELLTGYGEIAEVWFDGACGEGPNGKRQEYDWDGYYGVIRELMPKAAIAICGPDVRWCGNEAGSTRASEWSVIPGGIDASAQDVGSRDVLAAAAKRGAWLTWHPSEVDTSIRPGWFYHASEDDKVRPLRDLLSIYFGSVGGNAQLLLNIPPDRRGRISDHDVQRLQEIGDYLRATFATNLAAGAKASATNVRGHDPKYGADKTVDGDAETYWASDDGVTEAAITYEFAAPKTFNTAVIQEQIRTGQRIEEFALYAWADGDWKEIAHATTVGHKRILRFPEVTTEKVRLRISQSRVSATIANFGLYEAPAIP
jgi:alpha-L-fucosidase